MSYSIKQKRDCCSSSRHVAKEIKRNKNWRILLVKKKIYLINVVSSEQLQLGSPYKQTIFLIDLLNGRLDKKQVINKFSQRYPAYGDKWAAEYINLLQRQRVIRYVEKKPKEFSNKYLLGLDRQLDILAELGSGKSSYENQLTLKNTRVAVLGLGSVSHYTILALLASGVGFFRCVDFDVVEKRNIGRQPIFGFNDVGKSKSSVVAKFIKNSRCGIDVEPLNKMLRTEEDIEEAIHNCDVVIQSCDLPRFLIHRMINNVCLRLKKPNILLYSGRVGPFNIPYKTACYGCLETKLRKKFKLYNFLVDNINSSEFTRFPELAVVGAISGMLAAKELVGHVLGIRPETYNGFFDINPYTLKIELHHLSRQKNCYACTMEAE